MKLKVKAISDIGLLKKNNEDMALISSTFIRDNSQNQTYDYNSKNIFAVADGVGGAEGGEIASKFVLENLYHFFHKEDLSSENIISKLKDWAETTNNLLLKYSEKLEYKGMGTTLSAMLFYIDQVYILNAGDSRIYRFRDGILRQLTRDHSLRELTKNKDISNNIIYNAFGKKEKFFIDIENISSHIHKGDIYLICSDGLSDMLSSEEITNCLKENESAKLLMHHALQAGGKDNITFITIEIIN